jgi:hypothetical protein
MTRDEDGNAGWVSSHDETALSVRLLVTGRENRFWGRQPVCPFIAVLGHAHDALRVTTGRRRVLIALCGASHVDTRQMATAANE